MPDRSTMTNPHMPRVEAGEAETFQSRNVEWMAHVFGDVGDPTNLDERRDRFAEEAMELIQATGGTLDGVIAQARYTFGRPKGEPAQEAGGTLTTLACLLTYAGVNMVAAGEAELARCWAPEVVEKVRRKRANRHGRGVLPGNDADLVSAPAPQDTAEAMAEVERPFPHALLGHDASSTTSQPTSSTSTAAGTAETKNGSDPTSIFDRRHVEALVREWMTGPGFGLPPAPRLIDGLVDALRRRLARADVAAEAALASLRAEQEVPALSRERVDHPERWRISKAILCEISDEAAEACEYDDAVLEQVEAIALAVERRLSPRISAQKDRADGP